MYYFNNGFAYEHYQKKIQYVKIVEIVLIVLQNWFIIINYSDAAWDITFVENYIIRKIQKTMSREA